MSHIKWGKVVQNTQNAKPWSTGNASISKFVYR